MYEKIERKNELKKIEKGLREIEFILSKQNEYNWLIFENELIFCSVCLPIKSC